MPAADWRGSVGVAIQVRDERGVGIASARVSLLRGEGGAGPPAAFTDESGRLEVDGLAAGEWQIDVRREGYMIYTGYLDLEMGEMPRVGFSSRQRTGTFWAELDVSFAPAGSSAELFATDSKQAQAAQRRLERELKAEEKERERELRRAERGDLARVVETAPEEETASARETASATAAVGAEREDETAIAAEDDVAAPREPAARAEATAEAVPDAGALGSEATGSEATGTEAPGTGAPDPAAPPIGIPSADARVLPAGACRECGPGEWSATSPVRTRPSDAASPGCPGRLDRRLADVVEQLASLPKAAGLVGPLWVQDGRDALQDFPRDQIVNVRSRLEALSGPSRSCVLAAVAIPAGSRYIGYRFTASDEGGAGECRGEEPCSIGESQWLDVPTVVQGSGGAPTLVWAVFANESAERTRDAELTVYFVPPAGWRP